MWLPQWLRRTQPQSEMEEQEDLVDIIDVTQFAPFGGLVHRSFPVSSMNDRTGSFEPLSAPAEWYCRWASENGYVIAGHRVTVSRQYQATTGGECPFVKDAEAADERDFLFYDDVVIPVNVLRGLLFPKVCGDISLEGRALELHVAESENVTTRITVQLSTKFSAYEKGGFPVQEIHYELCQ